MERDGAHAEGAEQDGEPLGFEDGACEDDDCLAGELVAEVDQVCVLLHLREEEVVLDQGGNGLVLGRRHADLQWVAQTGPLQALDFARHGG